MHIAPDRLPPLPADRLDEAQQAAAAALIAGPRKAVKGPFIPLLRSPDLMDRVQRVGEYLRFRSVLPARISEFAILVVARLWTQQFEWFVHVPLALKAGTSAQTLETLRSGARPQGMDADETLVYELLVELDRNRAIGDAPYAAALQRFGERGVVELVSLAGYFAMLSMVMNVAGTPPEPDVAVQPLPPPAA